MNELLRNHVTSTKFVLSLGATHIAALAWIEWEVRHDFTVELRADIRGAFPQGTTWSHLVPGQRGLYERGLVEDLPYTRTEPFDKRTSRERWRITPAGQAVIFLLKEAGMWEEYSSLLPDPTKLAKT